MGNGQRIFNSEITIDESNRWYFRGQEIIHVFVLDFFRKNLFEDEKGIYILNSYGQFSEKGYVECYGFPLFFISWVIDENNHLAFRSNGGQDYSLQELNFYFDEKERIFSIPEGKKFTKIGFSKAVLNFLAEYMNEKDDEYFLEFPEHQKPISKFEDQFEIMVPVIL
jgi:hypothetical protein